MKNNLMPFLLGVLVAIFAISPQRYLEDIVSTWTVAYLNIEGSLSVLGWSEPAKVSKK